MIVKTKTSRDSREKGDWSKDTKRKSYGIQEQTYIIKREIKGINCQITIAQDKWELKEAIWNLALTIRKIRRAIIRKIAQSSTYKVSKRTSLEKAKRTGSQVLRENIKMLSYRKRRKGLEKARVLRIYLKAWIRRIETIRIVKEYLNARVVN